MMILTVQFILFIWWYKFITILLKSLFTNQYLHSRSYIFTIIIFFFQMTIMMYEILIVKYIYVLFILGTHIIRQIGCWWMAYRLDILSTLAMTRGLFSFLSVEYFIKLASLSAIRKLNVYHHHLSPRATVINVIVQIREIHANSYTSAVHIRLQLHIFSSCINFFFHLMLFSFSSSSSTFLMISLRGLFINLFSHIQTVSLLN